MQLTGKQLKQFQDALLDAYRSLSDLTIMVQVELNENLNTIIDGSNLNEAVFQLINWADAKGRLCELIEGAHRYNSGNQSLKHFIEQNDFAIRNTSKPVMPVEVESTDIDINQSNTVRPIELPGVHPRKNPTNLMDLIKYLMDLGGHLTRLLEAVESTYEVFIRIQDRRFERQIIEGLRRELQNIWCMLQYRTRIIENIRAYCEAVSHKADFDSDLIDAKWRDVQHDVARNLNLIIELENWLLHSFTSDEAPDPLELHKLMLATKSLYELLPKKAPSEPETIQELLEIASSLEVILLALRELGRIPEDF